MGWLCAWEFQRGRVCPCSCAYSCVCVRAYSYVYWLVSEMFWTPLGETRSDVCVFVCWFLIITGMFIWIREAGKPLQYFCLYFSCELLVRFFSLVLCSFEFLCFSFGNGTVSWDRRDIFWSDKGQHSDTYLFPLEVCTFLLQKPKALVLSYCISSSDYEWACFHANFPRLLADSWMASMMIFWTLAELLT